MKRFPTAVSCGLVESQLHTMNSYQKGNERMLQHQTECDEHVKLKAMKPQEPDQRLREYMDDRGPKIND